jgi:ubiquinol-cytochrome c reductase iron-sulfur subunit
MSEIEKTYPAGLATNIQKPISDPGIEPHRVRMTDKSEKAARGAEQQIAVMFGISIVGAFIAIWGFVAFPINSLADTRNGALWMGVGMALSLLGIGFGAVHWAKTLMPDHEVSEARHQARTPDEARAQAIAIIKTADAESGFTRRKLIRRSLYGALAVFPIPALVIFGDLGPQVGDTLKHTIWKKGVRLVRDSHEGGTPIKASEVTLGSVFHVVPENLKDIEDHGEKLNQKAKAAVLLVRVEPSELKEDPAKASWSYDGIVAYSKICTHVGCPVALYEQHTHHLLCPCHQSTFDLADHCKVIFGPAARPLPQLAIEVDAEGYLVAQGDFTEPVGPSFWDIRQS